MISKNIIDYMSSVIAYQEEKYWHAHAEYPDEWVVVYVDCSLCLEGVDGPHSLETLEISFSLTLKNQSSETQSVYLVYPKMFTEIAQTIASFFLNMTKEPLSHIVFF